MSSSSFSASALPDSSASRQRWLDLFDPAQAAAAAGAFETLDKAYAEPHRHYHTLAHVERVLATIDELTDDGTRLGAADLTDDDRQILYLAAWLHDVVYDPTRTDNELQSAVSLIKILAPLRVPDHVILDASRLVLATGPYVAPTDDLARVLVDADLAILAAPPEEYEAYRRAVRAEYAHVSDEDWAVGRSSLLADLLARPTIYTIAPFETAARANVEGELSHLS